MRSTFLFAFLLLLGCAATKHTVNIAPVQLATPVSGSAYYRSPEGAVSPSHYQKVGDFSFEVSSKAKPGKQSSLTLSLDEQLQEVISEKHADALVNVRVYPKSYRSGAIALGASRAFGWSMIGFSSLFFIGGVVEGGVGFVAVGGSSLLIGRLIARSVGSRWTFVVEGDAVQYQEY